MGIKDAVDRMRRIVLIASKPDKDEYKQSVKIISLGFVIIGVIGFLIFLAVQLLGGL